MLRRVFSQQSVNPRLFLRTGHRLGALEGRGERLEQQTSMLGNLGDVRVAQGKLQDALDAYQQGLKIRQTLAEQDKSNLGWQRGGWK